MLIFFDAQMDLEFGMFSSVETQKQSISFQNLSYNLHWYNDSFPSRENPRIGL